MNTDRVLTLVALLAAFALAGCAATPGAGVAVTPIPATAKAVAATTVPAPPDQEPAATAGVITSEPPSTVDLATLKTATPVPLPPTGADVTIGETSNGQTVSLKAGQTLAVLLPPDAWGDPAFDLTVLKPLPWPGIVPENYRAWLFQALAAGATAISVQTISPPCPPPGGGPCSMIPIKLFQTTVAVAP
jgi:predicted small secreted protein